MTLNVNWSKLNPPITEDEKDSPAFSVGVTLLALGLRKVETVEDVKEVMVRATFYEKLYGPIMRNNAGDSLATNLPFWQRWLGVSINNNTETRKAWSNRVTAAFLSDKTWDLRKITLEDES